MTKYILFSTPQIWLGVANRLEHLNKERFPGTLETLVPRLSSSTSLRWIQKTRRRAVQSSKKIEDSIDSTSTNTKKKKFVFRRQFQASTMILSYE